MKAKRTWFVGGALMLFAASCNKPPPAAPPKAIVTYVTARSAPPESQSSMPAYLGAIKGDREIDLSFKIGGSIELIGPRTNNDWREGGEVKKDRLLARLAQPTKIPQGQEDQIQKDSKILAPFDGFVLARMANSGEIVAAGRPVLRFGDLSQMLVELGLPDTVVSKMKVGQEVLVKIAALEDAPFAGHVTEVGLAAQPGSRLYKVVIKVPNPQHRIRSGMAASVSLGEKGSVSPEAVIVPLSALITSTKPETKERLAVFVVSDDGNVQERVVETGDIVESSIIIMSGVKAGQHVVTLGAGTLYDGAQVTARPAPTP